MPLTPLAQKGLEFAATQARTTVQAYTTALLERDGLYWAKKADIASRRDWDLKRTIYENAKPEATKAAMEAELAAAKLTMVESAQQKLALEQAVLDGLRERS